MQEGANPMTSSMTTISTADHLEQHRITSLPIAVLHVHSRCNCRCTMCDIWQGGQTQELSAEQLRHMLPSFETLDVRWVVLTGGEPLLHHDLAGICLALKECGIKVTVLTTGLLLSRFADVAADLFDEIIVSIDGPAAVHDRIRGVKGAFAKIATGMASVRSKSRALPLRARTTVQKANHLHLRKTIDAANALSFDSISFLAADLTSNAFNRELVWPVPRQNEIGLSMEEMLALDNEVELLIDEYQDDLNSGFIVESPTKLRRIVRHFRTQLGLECPEAPLCTAPWHSAVIELDGSIRPCFFQPAIGNVTSGLLHHEINKAGALQFRSALDIATNATCQRCVCSLNYRER